MESEKDCRLTLDSSVFVCLCVSPFVAVTFILVLDCCDGLQRRGGGGVFEEGREDAVGCTSNECR